ncbi:MAG: Gfo/Idh/MocA family oxidoreductase, partial [Candidatus Firestonebacteria bacterium]
ALVKDAKIVVACDMDKSKAEKLAKEYNIGAVSCDVNEVLKRKDIDAVSICTPNLAHYTVSMAAMKAGKHVLCEKPLAMNPKQVSEMIAQSKKYKVKLTCIQNQRFIGQSQAIKRFIDAGNAGKIYYAEAKWLRRRNLPGWNSGFITRKLGGGPCLDIGVHALDLAMWFMGNPKPVSVSGIADNYIAKKGALNLWGKYDVKAMDVEDFAGGLVRFDNGAALLLTCSFMVNMKNTEYNAIELFGDKNGIHYPSAEYFGEENGSLVDGKLVHIPVQDGHAAQIMKFSEFVAGKTRVNPVPPEQTLNVIKVLDGIHRSNKAGREVRL